MRNHWILGSKVTDLGCDEFLAEIDRLIDENRRDVIHNTNVRGILLARRHAWLRETRNRARIVHCDGAGVVLGARVLGHRTGPRLSLNDHIWTLARHCRDRDYSMYLLGATADVVAAAAQTLQAAVPEVALAGYDSGHFDMDGRDNDKVIARINEARPHVLLVGMGMPLQEAWILRNLHRLDVNVVIPVGGLFKLLGGALPFAPAWVSRNGLEWAYLSLNDPKRFFQRYLRENPVFLALILLQRLGLVTGGESADATAPAAEAAHRDAATVATSSVRAAREPAPPAGQPGEGRHDTALLTRGSDIGWMEVDNATRGDHPRPR